MEQVTLNIHGVGLHCDIDDPRVAKYILGNLGLFAGDVDPSEVTIEAAYRLSGTLGDVRALAAQVGAEQQAGGRLFVGSGVVVHSDANWYAYSLEQRQGKILATLFANNGTEQKTKGIGRAILRPGSHRRIKALRLQQVMRLLAHFPTFWLLERDMNIAVIHGAAIARNGRAVVLTGLDAVGKSTLALYLCQHRGFSLLADNFVLTDGERILAFPEMARLATDAMEAVGVTDPLARFDERTYVSTHRFTGVLEAECAAIVINRIGDGVHMHPAPSSSTESELRSMWQYLPEFIEYGRFRTLCSYLGGQLWPNDHSLALRKLTANHPCFILIKGRLDQLPQVADLVEQCI